jgi:hypothetical protein
MSAWYGHQVAVGRALREADDATWALDAAAELERRALELRLYADAVAQKGGR